MNPNAFRSALRMARREALRHKWRSLLVVLLIGFPVFVLSVGDIAYRSWQLDPSERITREIGAADAAIQAMDGCDSITQAPKAWLGDGYRCDATGNQAGDAAPPRTAASTQSVLAALPAGSTAVERLVSYGGARIKTKIGVKYADIRGFDYASPIVKGMVKQKQGRAPRAADEVALTTALAKSVGAHVGDTIRLLNPDRSMKVVGIVQDARYRKIQTAYTVPSGITDDGSEKTWFVHTPTPVSWSAVLQFNTQQFVVLSRSVFLNPPPKSQVPFYTSQDGQNHVPAQVIATVTLIAGMALLEIVLLAGPAFAVGARRQRRELALIAAVGGQTRDLRNVVLANGVVLGVIAGVSAAFGAVLAAFVGMPTLGTLVDQIPGHTDIRPLELAGIACVSLVTALLAAIFPALQAARTDIIAALAGRRGTVRTKRHVPLIGAVVVAIGVLVAVLGVTRRNSATTILAGVVVTEVGLIICTPALLGAAARLGRVLPLGPRIALRDAGRNRSAATPAVAAVMASMIGAVGILIAITSSEDHDRRQYTPSLPSHAVWATLPFAGGPTPADGVTADQVRTVLSSTLPVDKMTVVRAPSADSNCVRSPKEVHCRGGSSLVLVKPLGEQRLRYQGGAFPMVLVDDGSGVGVLFGKAEPDAVSALRAGRAVVTDAAILTGGKVQLGVYDENSQAPTGPNDPLPIVGQPLELAATVVTDGFPAAAVIVPPSAVARYGEPEAIGVLATTTHLPTDHQTQAARGQLQALDPDAYLQVESGYHNPGQWALYLMIGIAGIIALGAASIATALANTDGRDDLVTLGAVGASPRTRRVMSMSRAGVVAGLGCVVGVAAGFVPAFAWVRGDRATQAANAKFFGGGRPDVSLHFVVPWTPILIALVGIPLIAALLAGLVTRSRLPSERVRST